MHRVEAPTDAVMGADGERENEREKHGVPPFHSVSTASFVFFFVEFCCCCFSVKESVIGVTYACVNFHHFQYTEKSG